VSEPRRLDIEVVYALPAVQHCVRLSLPAGATVADALAAVAGRPPFDQVDVTGMPVGVFGDRVSGDRPLEPGDRVELYRPLQIDPREARRQRAGTRATKRGR
jgi:putative ubiquitin-RnfH superfamily antitoxin RatB of RatAB toxin-antitoxin module